MFEEIQDVIRKNLPAEVGEQLKKYLAAADVWKQRSEESAAKIAHLEGIIKGGNERIVFLEGKLKMAGDLDKREKDVWDRECKMDVMRAQLEARNAEARLADIKELTAMVFRNPTYMKKTAEQNSVPVGIEGCTYPQSGSETKTGRA